MKIVIYNEPNYRAGGIESIYQLCDIINKIGGNCYIKYVNDNFSDPVPDEYKKYKNIKITKKIEDTLDTLVIFAEVWTSMINNFKNCKKAIWWLSVDNNQKKFQDFKNKDIIHLYQSEYARLFLEKNNADIKFEMTDYIEGIQFNNTIKKDIITFNPAKGQEAISFLKAQAPQLPLIPLTNMSKEQIYNTLCSSKLYVDFGHHPGRDRIPREAILCENIVLTSCLGSAKNNIDIPIPEKYKLKEVNKSTPEMLFNILNNYDTIINEFKTYSHITKNNEQHLQKCVEKFLNSINKK